MLVRNLISYLIGVACLFFSNGYEYCFASTSIVDERGRVIIPPAYASVELVGKDQFLTHTILPGTEKPGEVDVKQLFNRNGKQVPMSSLHVPWVKPSWIPPAYTVETALPSGLIVRTDAQNGNKLGFFTRKGRSIMPYEFDVLRYVAGSRLFAMQHDGSGIEQYFLYDLRGHMVAKLPDVAKNFDSYFSEGLLLVGDTKGRAFVDRNGRIKIQPSDYRYSFPFHDGLADVELEHNGQPSSGYINKKGKLVIGPFDGVMCGEFTRGLAMLTRGYNERFGAVDKHGHLVFPIEFEPFHPYLKDVIFAGRNGKLQLFRRNGKLVTTFPADAVSVWAANFDQNDIVPFNVGGTARLLNTSTADGGIWGYCDKRGRVVIKPQFPYAGWFQGRLAIASDQDKFGETTYGLIDRKGVWVVPAEFLSITAMCPDRFALYKDPLNRIERAWRSGRSTQLFLETLKFYDFIGMNESDLVALLGSGHDRIDKEPRPATVAKLLYYDLTPNARHGASCVEFGLDQGGKVWGWRILTWEKTYDWYTTNQVAREINSNLTPENLTPKSAVH